MRTQDINDFLSNEKLHLLCYGDLNNNSLYLKSNNMKLYYIKMVEIAYFVQNVGNEIDVTGN